MQATEPVAEFNKYAWQANPAGFMGPADTKPSDLEKLIVDWAISTKPKSILDIGCIDGRFCRWLRESGFTGKYEGIDITPAFTDEARRRMPTETFRAQDVRDILLQERFDLVLCANVLQHLPTLDEGMEPLFGCARRHVLLAIYGTEQPERQATPSGDFLNFWYPKAEVLKCVRDGWKEARFESIVPAWDTSKLLHVYLFEKEIVAPESNEPKPATTTAPAKAHYPNRRRGDTLPAKP